MMIVSTGVTSAVDAIYIGQCHINIAVYTVYVLSACLAVLMYTE